MTVTSEYFLSLKPGVDNGTIVQPGATATGWSYPNTAYAGYSGSGYAMATDPGGESPLNGPDGARMPFDVSAIPTGTYKTYTRVYAPNGGSDSWYLQADSGTPFFENTSLVFPTGWEWIENDTFSIDGSETEVNVCMREGDLGFDRIIFVSTAETNPPTGEEGYTTNDPLNADYGVNRTVLANQTGLTHEASLDGVGLSVTNFVVTSTVAGIVITEGTPYESVGSTFFPITFDSGADGSGDLDFSITASGIGYAGGVNLTVSGNQAPVITDPVSFSIDTGAHFTYNWVATDAESDAFTFYWDDYNPPAWLNLYDDGLMEGTPFKVHVGTINPMVKCKDVNGNESSITFPLTVSHTDQGPTFSINGYRGAHVGKLFTMRVNTDAAEFMQETPVLDWDDGFTPPAWLSIAGNDVQGTPAEGDVSASIALDFKATLNSVDYTYSTTIEVFSALGGSSNQTPFTTDIATTTPFNTAIQIDVSGNVTEPDGDTVTYSIIQQPTKGSVVLDDAALGLFTYTPTGEGDDLFTWGASDGSLIGKGAVRIVVGANPAVLPTISGVMPAGKVDEAYSFTPTSTGADSFSIDITIPGLSFSTVTGTLSGDPTTQGTYGPTITATNTKGNAEKAYTLIIAAADVIPPTVTTTTGDIVLVYSDASNVEQIIKINASQFDRTLDKNTKRADTDSKDAVVTTVLGSRDNYSIRIPEILRADLAEYQSFETALNLQREVQVTDPNDILPNLTFPMTTQLIGDAVIKRKNTCEQWELSFKLERLA